jgi:hypothetical protein
MQNALGLELVRDCNSLHTMETLLRYRGSVFAELFRSLETLKGPSGRKPECPYPYGFAGRYGSSTIYLYDETDPRKYARSRS